MKLVPLKSKPLYGSEGVRLVEGKVVGKIYYTWKKQDLCLIIDYLTISKKERRKGYAQQGLNLLLKNFPKAKRVKTTTISNTNKGSLALFKSLGFTIKKKGSQLYGLLKLVSETSKSKLFRLFMATLFVGLTQTDPRGKSEKDWFKEGMEEAFEIFAYKAVGTLAAPSPLKREEDIFRFHLHAIRFSWADWVRDGTLKRHKALLDKIIQEAHHLVTKDPEGLTYKNTWTSIKKILAKI